MRLGPAEIDEIIAAKKFLYMWGRVKYFDVFDAKEHITRFCWLITASGDPHSFRPDKPTLLWGYITRAEGNRADDEREN